MKGWYVVIAVLVLGAIQVGCNFWLLRPNRAVAQRLERIHVDTVAGLIYATFATDRGSMTIAMTPRAAAQMQVEIGSIPRRIPNGQL